MGNVKNKTVSETLQEVHHMQEQSDEYNKQQNQKFRSSDVVDHNHRIRGQLNCGLKDEIYLLFSCSFLHKLQLEG